MKNFRKIITELTKVDESDILIALRNDKCNEELIRRQYKEQIEKIRKIAESEVIGDEEGFELIEGIISKMLCEK